MEHKHFFATLHVANPPKDPGWVKDWLADLVDRIDMKIMINPVAEYCDEPNNEGVTGFVVITTSHISIHIWDTGLVHLDVFSCRHFDTNDLICYITDCFEIIDMKTAVHDRTPN